MFQLFQSFEFSVQISPKDSGNLSPIFLLITLEPSVLHVAALNIAKKDKACLNLHIIAFEILISIFRKINVIF
jgi:hypothetical protein